MVALVYLPAAHGLRESPWRLGEAVVAHLLGIRVEKWSS